MLLAIPCFWVVGYSTLSFLKEFASTRLLDDPWLTMEAGGLEMVVSAVPVHSFHRCSTVLVMLQ